MGRSPACPACAEPLVVFELEGIEIDRCLACGGTWLDEGEVALIAERAGLAPDTVAARRTPDAERSSGDRRGAPRATGARHCPRCGGSLEATPGPGASSEIELDRCPRGDGLWFDAKELERVLESWGEPAGAAVGAFLAKLFRSKSVP